MNELLQAADRHEHEAERLLEDDDPKVVAQLAQAHATLALSLRLGAAQHADGAIHIFGE